MQDDAIQADHLQRFIFDNAAIRGEWVQLKKPGKRLKFNVNIHQQLLACWEKCWQRQRYWLKQSKCPVDWYCNVVPMVRYRY